MFPQRLHTQVSKQWLHRSIHHFKSYWKYFPIIQLDGYTYRGFFPLPMGIKLVIFIFHSLSLARARTRIPSIMLSLQRILWILLNRLQVNYISFPWKKGKKGKILHFQDNRSYLHLIFKHLIYRNRTYYVEEKCFRSIFYFALKKN